MVECKDIDLTTDKVKQYEAVREAMNSASLKKTFLSIQVSPSG